MGSLISTWLHEPSMRQTVIGIEVYERDLRSGSADPVGVADGGPGVKHRAVVAKTSCGERYLIEKGVSSGDDTRYKKYYRSGEYRIILVTEMELETGVWKRTESVPKVTVNLTLQNLFDACGEQYNLLTGNFGHGVQQMLEQAKPRWHEVLSFRNLTILLIVLIIFINRPVIMEVMACVLSMLIAEKIALHFLKSRFPALRMIAMLAAVAVFSVFVLVMMALWQDRKRSELRELEVMACVLSMLIAEKIVFRVLFLKSRFLALRMIAVLAAIAVFAVFVLVTAVLWQERKRSVLRGLRELELERNWRNWREL